MATTKLLIKLTLSIFLILNCIPNLSFSCLLHQKQALLHFKHTLTTILNSSSIDVVTLNSWNPNSDCCTWDYVACDTATNVTGLYLSYVITQFDHNPVMVSSDILTPLFHIRSLKILDISSNSLLGQIPGDGLSNLTELVDLRMGENNFNDSIPNQIFELKSLQFLDLHSNFLDGVLSPKVSNIQNLEYLYLQGNLLSGNIPEEIGNLTKLKEFHLGNNQFSGGIPSTIINLRELELLNLFNNSFSMQIPEDIGRLPNMTMLDLSKNQFTGPIPSSIRNLSKLENLMIQQNKLTGDIPTWLFNITTLISLCICGEGSNLIWNNKAKIVPSCNLHVISMSNCGIYGQIPEWISSQRELFFLDLSMNQLEGRLPDWLVDNYLEALVLSDNKFNGSLSSRLFESEGLELLALARNNFSGELPKTIGNASWMSMLMLSGNQFSGEIPMSMSNMYLHTLDLSRNKFSGDRFPVFREPDSESPYPSYFDFSFNEIFGKIPTSFPTSTRVLSLGGNRFSGDLPSNLTNLVNLESLDLQGNDITGKFQDVLPQIPTLQILNLRNNSLRGFIPKKISNLSSLRILDLSGNNLTGSIPQEIANLQSMIETPNTIHNPFYIVSSVYDGLNEDVFLFDNFRDGVEFNDLIVNWKNSFQGLPSHSLSLYSILDLSDNRLSGEIPALLGDLKGLKVLNILHNNISGHIPTSFGSLTHIESLDFSHNKISGSIPQSLAKLEELSILDVSNNRLTGKIPMGQQINTLDELKYYANNSGLCGMQIRIRCPEDIPPPEGTKDEEADTGEENKILSLVFWKGTWVGFAVGLLSSMLIIGYFLNFLQLFKLW